MPVLPMQIRLPHRGIRMGEVYCCGTALTRLTRLATLSRDAGEGFAAA